MFNSVTRKCRFLKAFLLFHAILYMGGWVALDVFCSSHKCNPKTVHFVDQIPENDWLNMVANNTQRRLDETRKFLEKYEPKFLRNYTDIMHPSVVVSIITMNRRYPEWDKADYLTQVTGKVLKLLEEESESGRYLKSGTILPFICNIDLKPKEFQEAAEFSEFLRVVSAYDVSHPNYGGMSLRKEKDDYVFCLETALRIWPSASYVILLEDDALPKFHFIVDIRNVIRQLEFRKKRKLQNTGNVAFVKLYHPETLRKLPWFIIGASCSILVSLSVTYCLFHVGKKITSQRTNGRSLEFVLLVLTFLLQASFWTSIVYVIGQVNFAHAMKRVSGSIYLTMPESCCTPVVLFPAETAGVVLDFLKSRTAKLTYAKDHIMDELPRATGLQVLQSDTNLVIHIGQYSTLRVRGAPGRTDE